MLSSITCTYHLSITFINILHWFWKFLHRVKWLYWKVTGKSIYVVECWGMITIVYGWLYCMVKFIVWHLCYVRLYCMNNLWIFGHIKYRCIQIISFNVAAVYFHEFIHQIFLNKTRNYFINYNKITYNEPFLNLMWVYPFF